jgi:hypothetical protein
MSPADHDSAETCLKNQGSRGELVGTECRVKPCCGGPETLGRGITV